MQRATFLTKALSNFPQLTYTHLNFTFLAINVMSHFGKRKIVTLILGKTVFCRLKRFERPGP